MSTRRDFLKISSLASAAMLMPGFLHKLSGQSLTADGRKLVIIQLSGGNDGLNTVIPFEDDLYYKARPSLGIAKDKVLKLNDYQGLNPALEGLREIYDQGYLTVLNSVGYPNPDRSHFRSMDIWHTGSESDQYWDTGWLGRYLDHNCEGKPHQMIEVDGTLSLALKGTAGKGLAMTNPTQLKNTLRDPWIQHLTEHPPQIQDDDLGYLYKTMTETHQSVNYISETVKRYRSTVSYPGQQLGQRLKLVAELINSGVETTVFYVSLSGFDTHVRQEAAHDRLLKGYSEAVAAFVKALQQAGNLDRTLIMTFSEFGRRVKQNASGGTDHGKANNLFLIGGQLTQPGVFNEAPNLSKLDDGDVSLGVDFREVYATLLENWLMADAQQILGKSFSPLGLV